MNTQMNILFFSTFPPRECGIANFTKDLSLAIKSADPSAICQYIAISDVKEGYRYAPSDRILLEIGQSCFEDYEKAATYANVSGADVVSVQHEFGIFGGFDGGFLLDFLKKCRVPKVITWHTVPLLPQAKRRARRLSMLREMARLCDANVCITRSCREFVVREKIAPAGKTFYIPHGAPFFDIRNEKAAKKRLGLLGKFVIATHGMISENKGLENAILAMPEILKKHKNVVYLIIGATHPLKPKTYLEALKKMVRQKRLNKNVVFIEKYLSLEELIEYLLAVDVHITPYLVPEQASSGALCYAVAAGKYNISTPFEYAKEVLDEGRGKLVPFRDPAAIARAVLEALSNQKKVKEIRKKAYEFGQQFVWSNVARNYLELFEKVKR